MILLCRGYGVARGGPGEVRVKARKVDRGNARGVLEEPLGGGGRRLEAAAGV